MAKKSIKARVFFGEDLAHYMADGDRKEAKELYENGDGAYCERTFKTEAERNAYYLGLSDMEGWGGAYPLEDNERKPAWAKHNQTEL